MEILQCRKEIWENVQHEMRRKYEEMMTEWGQNLSVMSRAEQKQTDEWQAEVPRP